MASRPSVADLTGDNAVAVLARKHWLTKSPSKVLPDVVRELYDAVENDAQSPFVLLLLEQLQAFERYLWPGYSDEASNQHTLLLVLLANTKRAEHLPVWTLFEGNTEVFSSFFRRVTGLSIDSSLPVKLRSHVLSFLVAAFQSLDSGLIRKECAPLVSIGIWQNLHSDHAREVQLAKAPQIQKAWRANNKKFDNADAASQARLRFERSWLYTLVLDFLDRLYDADASVDQKAENLVYCERFMEFLCDLLSQLPTRRYVNTLLRDVNIIAAIKLSPVYQDGDESVLLREMLDLLSHYVFFPADDHSGRQLNRAEYEEEHNKDIARLQNVALKMQPEKLKILILASFGSLSQRVELLGHLKDLTDAELIELCAQLGLRTTYPEKSQVVQDRAFFDEVLASTIESKEYFTERIRNVPTLPTESSLYEPSLLRTDAYDGTRPLAIPKFNLQYLSPGDFLHRAFTLYRAESFYSIRKHVEDTVKRLQPRRQAGQGVRFDGFSRMAIPIAKPAFIDVLPAKVGETVPAEVRVEVILDVSRLQPGLRREWEGLREGDVVFLVGVQPNEQEKRLTNGTGTIQTANEKAGVNVLRSGEVTSVLDENGRILRAEQGRKHADADGVGRVRQRRVIMKLDAASYKADKERADAGKGDVYDYVNVIIRRRARENNFKPVLESLKQLVLSDTPVPTWLMDVFLGFGDPSSASYKRLPNMMKSVDFRDTFVDWQHLVGSLEGKTVEVDPNAGGSFGPPYVLESVEGAAPTAAEPAAERPRKKRRKEQSAPAAPPPDATAAASPEAVKVSTYQPENHGPYPTDVPKTNSIRFTPKQIEAITSGTQPGLSLVVGPPGTGKTDVVTQIISNIYHNNPNQRTLLVAHSNQALNQLFQKIVGLDIDERHLLRLGHGEEELETEGSFSRAGRIDRFMERGAVLLARVQSLADSMGAVGAHGGSCENAENFFRVWIEPKWKGFWNEVEAGRVEDLRATFPFRAFFADADAVIFPSDASTEIILENIRGCERHIRRLFEELADIRPFEILRNQRDKSNYLLVKEARIIAMTTTHAAIRRQEIANLGFRYENVIMEEAAQVTEAEGFVPLAMQKAREKSGEGLQRVVLVGDHLQNSPVIQNAAFRSYANLEQSLFQRLIRLGVPHTVLDAQGRSRPSIAELYKWRYPHLTNLPFTATSPEFTQANAGLRYEYQFIDVPNYKDAGETEPSPHFIQNLGEAEYAVALFQYMRLLGYPAERISILCAYAGQRALIGDVLRHRCKNNRLFGMPGWVGTVDKYQGEQNDYVILSLVRTKTPGYLRDIRRLTVALSRARLGLYVLGRREVFESSLELREAFGLLFERSNKLQLVTNEMFPATRGVDDETEATEMDGVEHLGQYVYQMTQAMVKQLKENGGLLPRPAATQGQVEDEDEDQDQDGEEELGEEDQEDVQM